MTANDIARQECSREIVGIVVDSVGVGMKPAEIGA